MGSTVGSRVLVSIEKETGNMLSTDRLLAFAFRLRIRIASWRGLNLSADRPLRRSNWLLH